ncbi:MAG: hypothetical protein AAFR03_02240 [Pseudomonadota bacterium]
MKGQTITSAMHQMAGGDQTPRIDTVQTARRLLVDAAFFDQIKGGEKKNESADHVNGCHAVVLMGYLLRAITLETRRGFEDKPPV